jgi:hypothetical protein
MAERWLRLNATWGESEWLIVLPPLQRLTWIEILCWVKLRGVAGRCRRPSTASVRVRTGVPEADIEALEKAAVEAEALAIEGDEWVIVKWRHYCDPGPTGAEWRALRQAVFQRDGGRCAYCGSVPERPHCDHVKPRSRGGLDRMDNLVTACPSCNSSKRDRTPEEWIQ